MSTRELASCSISWYPNPLDREVEVPPILCPKPLVVFDLAMMHLAKLPILVHDSLRKSKRTKFEQE